jgi:phospholipid/cholesterol/gamma-HCH transport system permease protein
MATVPGTAPVSPSAPEPTSVPVTPGAWRRYLTELGDLSSFSLKALATTPGSVRYTAEILRQTSILVRSATFFIAALVFFIGFSQTTFSFFVLQAFGAADFGGAVSGIVTPRFTAPFTAGYAFSAIIGTSLVAEIGAMKINEETDAYEAEGVSPMRFIVGTRVAAIILFAPIAAAVALVADGFGSFVNLTAVVGDLNPSTFWRFHWGLQSIADLLFAMVTIAVVGVVTALVGAYYGYRASGGPAGVGTAAARSLVVNLPLTQAITGLAVFAVYGENLDLRLPVGG